LGSSILKPVVQQIQEYLAILRYSLITARIRQLSKLRAKLVVKLHIAFWILTNSVENGDIYTLSAAVDCTRQSDMPRLDSQRWSINWEGRARTRTTEKRTLSDDPSRTRVQVGECIGPPAIASSYQCLVELHSSNAHTANNPPITPAK
jgi:hypothetical protein